jgi:membrane-bound lytic murein transglycosylase D
MKVKYKHLLFFLAGAVLATSVILSFSFKEPDKGDAGARGDNRLQYKWYSPELPTNLDFCGEKVPLNRWDVRERLDRELNSNYYQHGGTLYLVKLSTRYFPILEKIFRENGIPDDFKYVCIAESALQQASQSPVGAASYWQFMKDTGPRYGLEINDEVDERYNIYKSTDAACKYFKDAYTKFGSWTAAAASYNCGQGGYNNFSDYQGTKYYYDLAFPEETNRYVFRILALKYLLSHARSYGYIVEPAEEYKPIPSKKITVTNTISDLAAFAKENGSNYKMLKLLNPWLRNHSLTVKNGKKYEIELPM